MIIERVWELLHSTINIKFFLIRFYGHQFQVIITPYMIREALAICDGNFEFETFTLNTKGKRDASSTTNPNFDHLRHPNFKIELQLPMKHFTTKSKSD